MFISKLTLLISLHAFPPIFSGSITPPEQNKNIFHVISKFSKNFKLRKKIAAGSGKAGVDIYVPVGENRKYIWKMDSLSYWLQQLKFHKLNQPQ